MRAIQLWDLVQPRYDKVNVWRVIEIDATRSEITAEKRPCRLGEICPRCTSSPDFFISLEEEGS